MPHLGSTIHDKEGRFHKEPLYGNQHQRASQGNTHGTGQYPGTFLTVSPAESLGGQSTGTHTQEAEIPIKKIEEHRTYGDAADHCGSIGVKMAGNGNIHHSDNRDGDIGQNARNGQFKDVFVYGDSHVAMLLRMTIICIYLLRPAYQDMKNSGHS